jgi:hypothetical protein
MDAQERIILRLFAEQHCPRCGSPYQSESVLVLARRSEVWMIMISCSSCQQKDTFVVKFPIEMQGRRRVTSYRLSRPPSTPLPEEQQQPSPEISTPSTPSEPITSDDVLDMHLFLQDFNGDFQRLFNEEE